MFFNQIPEGIYMSNFFIANCTQQNQVINFRLPDSARAQSLNIPMGRQIPIGGNAGLSLPQVDAVVEQLRVFGLLSISELKGMQGKIPFVYSDKPIKAEVILHVLAHNKSFLMEGGQKRRQMAALAANQQIDAFTQEAGLDPIRTLEMSVEEENRGSFGGGDDKAIAEGVRVASQNQPRESRGRRSKRG